MRSQFMHTSWSLFGVVVLGTLLTGCGNRQPETPEPLQPAPAEPQTTAAPGQAPQPDAAVATLPARKSSAPAASSAPELSDMKVAQVVSEKLGVPVELRYQLDGDAMAGGPVTLHLAAVPRVAGKNLTMSIKQESGIEFPRDALHAAKVDAATPYRQQLQLARQAGGPDEIRVLVTMDFPIGTGFTYFSVPLGGGAAKTKESTP
jgi:hypothetical protein